MLTETQIHPFSQLAYLDVPEKLMRGAPPTVGELAGYYTTDLAGRAYLKSRFGEIPQEYADWKQFLSEGVDPVREYRIVHVLDENRRRESGFYGCSYRSPQGELIAAFRGSEMLGNRRYKNDYETDLALAYAATTPQQAVAERYLRAFGDFGRVPYYVTGHSLGGNLAVHAAVTAPSPERMMGCYAFNAPGFNKEYAGQNSSRITAMKEKLHLLQNQHDLVSSLLLNIADPVILESTFNPRSQEEPGVLDILYPHSNFLYRQEGGEFVRVQDGRKDSLCTATGQLTRLFLHFPVAFRKRIAGLVLEILYSPRPPEKQVEYLLEHVTKEMVSGGLEADAKGLLLCGGLFAAKHLHKSRKTGELYARLYDDRDDANTSVADAALLLVRLLQREKDTEPKPQLVPLAARDSGNSGLRQYEATSAS